MSDYWYYTLLYYILPVIAHMYVCVYVLAQLFTKYAHCVQSVTTFLFLINTDNGR